jgi:hypothetical protein
MAEDTNKPWNGVDRRAGPSVLEKALPAIISGIAVASILNFCALIFGVAEMKSWIANSEKIQTTRDTEFKELLRDVRSIQIKAATNEQMIVTFQQELIDIKKENRDISKEHLDINKEHLDMRREHFIRK